MKNPLSVWSHRSRLHNPLSLRTLSDMENEMERWLEQSRRDWVHEYQGSDFIPACCLRENGKEYTVQFDIPGVKKDKVKIEIDNNRLTVSGERMDKTEFKDAKEYFSENFYGAFMRTIQLPSTVDENKIDAAYEDGVLTIKIPKAQSAKAKEIKIH